MQKDHRDVVLLVQADPWRGSALAERLKEQFHDNYLVLREASRAEAERALVAAAESGRRIAAVIADEDLPDGSGRELLRAAVVDAALPEASRLLLTVGAPDAGGAAGGLRLLPLSPADEDLWPVVEEMLFESAGPDAVKVVVNGDRRKKEVFRVLRFLQLNSILYKLEEPKSGCTVAVTVDGTELHDPKLIELAHRLKLVRHSGRTAYDLIVVGGGPAGLSAAVNAAALFLDNVLVIENVAPGGAAGTASNLIDNYLGFPDGVKADELAQRAMRQALNRKIDWMPAHAATELEQFVLPGVTLPIWYRVTVKTDDGKSASYTAPVVVAACGVAPRRQGGTDEARFEGQGVYYTALPSDAGTVKKGDKIAVVGAGDSAGRAALMFAKAGANVTMIIRNTLAKDMLPRLVKQIKEEKLITVLEHTNISEYKGGADNQLAGVVVKPGNKKLDVTAVYVLIGADPDTAWLEKAGVQVKRRRDTDKTGYVATDTDVKVKAGEKTPPALATSLPGVFAAGDVRYRGVRRISMAAGEGSSAALSVHNYLKDYPGVPFAHDDVLSGYYA
ncbi:FAD-dependent oxidoreductase [Streptomyces litmocidini]|uniref:FAD-dependent oxidoreductase n=1 Tax=Streptomyces litmocidini TaxID=67318 RepID=UPI0033F349D4